MKAWIGLCKNSLPFPELMYNKILTGFYIFFVSGNKFVFLKVKGSKISTLQQFLLLRT